MPGSGGARGLSAWVFRAQPTRPEQHAMAWTLRASANSRLCAAPHPTEGTRVGPGVGGAKRNEAQGHQPPGQCVGLAVLVPRIGCTYSRIFIEGLAFLSCLRVGGWGGVEGHGWPGLRAGVAARPSGVGVGWGGVGGRAVWPHPTVRTASPLKRADPSLEFPMIKIAASALECPSFSRDTMQQHPGCKTATHGGSRREDSRAPAKKEHAPTTTTITTINATPAWLNRSSTGVPTCTHTHTHTRACAATACGLRAHCDYLASSNAS